MSKQVPLTTTSKFIIAYCLIKEDKAQDNLSRYMRLKLSSFSSKKKISDLSTDTLDTTLKILCDRTKSTNNKALAKEIVEVVFEELNTPNNNFDIKDIQSLGLNAYYQQITKDIQVARPSILKTESKNYAEKENIEKNKLEKLISISIKNLQEDIQEELEQRDLVSNIYIKPKHTESKQEKLKRKKSYESELILDCEKRIKKCSTLEDYQKLCNWYGYRGDTVMNALLRNKLSTLKNEKISSKETSTISFDTFLLILKEALNLRNYIKVKLDKDMVLYRGFSLRSLRILLKLDKPTSEEDIIKHINDNKPTIKDTAFVSTSQDISVAEDFAYSKATDSHNGALLEIDAKKGTLFGRPLKNSIFTSESEFLLIPNQKIRLKEATKGKKQILIIKCETY